MTALMPAIAISPFRKQFDRGRSGFSDPGFFSCTTVHQSSLSLSPAHRTQGAAPAPSDSVTSATTVRNDENVLPPSTHPTVATPQKLPSHAASNTHNKDTKAFNWESTPKVQSNRRQPQPNRVSGSFKQHHKLKRSLNAREPRRKRSDDVRSRRNATQKSSEQASFFSKTHDYSFITESALHSEPFPSLQLDFSPTAPITRSDVSSRDLPQLSPPHRHGQSGSRSPADERRRRELSESSSAFVHTIRTASMSNGSFSIYPKSFRLGKSSDSDTYLGRHLRYSIDTERPMTTSSIDEAAFLRGMRRRQIIHELVTSEDSYIADLKALSYLYSTLLASATSIPSNTRVAIQRNVTGLLHLHESLQNDLHRAALTAAARKWADTASPARLGRTHYLRWRNKGSIGVHKKRYHRHMRTSTDSAEVAKAAFRLGSADPVDVLDIANIFHHTLASLFAYEEYCANHEIIAHELQRQTPVLWSTYEAGMESLGRILAALDQKPFQDKKSLTVADLLIKPIQRICKYPLLLQDLLRATPVADSPEAHEALDSALQRLREIVLAVNTATDSHTARSQIQRRWLIQDRLNLPKHGITADRFRQLGFAHLCGILFVTYQTASATNGCYALCVLFDHNLLIARPDADGNRFDLIAIINMCDLKIESAGDGKGMQCQSALYTWKTCFVAHANMHEILFSACSMVEEQQWLYGLAGNYKSGGDSLTTHPDMETQVFLDLKSVGVVFVSNLPVLRQSPIQRAATVGNRNNICQVILRNTHNPQDLQEYRNTSAAIVNRSLSHATACKVVVLAPKRSERAKLESGLSDIWTKDKLPFPGMISNKGSQILRASAGSLVRKLSLASIHAPFSRRTANQALLRQKSFDSPSNRPSPTTPVFQIRRDSTDECTPARTKRPKEFSELDTMDSVIGRMIADDVTKVKQKSFTGDKLAIMPSIGSKPLNSVGPKDSATVFYQGHGQAREGGHEAESQGEETLNIEEGLSGACRRKRWSNPLSMLKVLGGEGIKNMLHSSK